LLFETFVSIHRGGSRPLWCAGGVIRSVVNNIGGSRRWLITVTIQLTSTIACMEVCRWHAWHCMLCDSCA